MYPRIARWKLQQELENVTGYKVYFQPPPSIHLSYPVVIYHLSDIRSWHADNKKYLVRRNYQITLVTPNPDDPAIDNLSIKMGCALDTTFRKDQLNHYIFSLEY